MKLRASDAIAFLAIIIVIVALSAYALAATISEGIRVMNEPVEVKISALNGNKVKIGDVVTLCANLGGVKSRYNLRWETDDGNGVWREITEEEGTISADGLLYAFRISNENRNNKYRVLMTVN
ncbi:MAG: hypothetical protein CW338_05785 [Clostridiales bacterium]|nr:hypothetical protein [Clostridiales bacterium]